MFDGFDPKTGLGFFLKKIRKTGETYKCNHGVCTYWDWCRVKITDETSDIHPKVPIPQQKNGMMFGWLLGLKFISPK